MKTYQVGDVPTQAEVASMHWWPDDPTAPAGTVELKPVAVCKSDRVAWDGVDRYVMLNCIVCSMSDKKRMAVMCPRYPQGLHPGIWVGVPMIAACDMLPMPKQINRRNRCWN